MEAVKKMAPDMSDAYCDLDVTVLHSLIFDKCSALQKKTLPKQTKVTYTRSVHEALTGVQNGVAQCCFILNPTKVSQIKDVAKAGEKMPQKPRIFYQAYHGPCHESSGLGVAILNGCISALKSARPSTRSALPTRRGRS